MHPASHSEEAAPAAEKVHPAWTHRNTLYLLFLGIEKTKHFSPPEQKKSAAVKQRKEFCSAYNLKLTILTSNKFVMKWRCSKIPVVMWTFAKSRKIDF